MGRRNSIDPEHSSLGIREVACATYVRGPYPQR
jgi:hypothetical protein